MTKKQREQQKTKEAQTFFKNSIIRAAEIYPLLLKGKQITQDQRDDIFNKLGFFDFFISGDGEEYDLQQAILQTIADYAFLSAPNNSRKKTSADYELDEIQKFLKILKNMDQWVKNAARPTRESLLPSIKNLQTFFYEIKSEYKAPTIAQAGQDFTDKLFGLLVNAPQKNKTELSKTNLLKEIQALKVAIRTLHNPTFKKKKPA